MPMKTMSGRFRVVGMHMCTIIMVITTIVSLITIYMYVYSTQYAYTHMLSAVLQRTQGGRHGRRCVLAGVAHPSPRSQRFSTHFSDHAA